MLVWLVGPQYKERLGIGQRKYGGSNAKSLSIWEFATNDFDGMVGHSIFLSKQLPHRIQK